MTGISTHVLDTAQGKPAKNVPVSLEKQDAPDQWQLIGSGRTDQDGRCTQLLPDGQSLSPGTYRLAFDIRTYHSAQGAHGLYPVVHIIFTVRAGETHLHIPLLVSPHGYTTYRGS